MPHISTKKLSARVISDLEKNLDIILMTVSGNQRMAILQEIITKTERIMIAKRVALILLVDKGLSPYKISQYLGISPSTAERFQHMHTNGKFKYTNKLIKKYKGVNRIISLMADLLAPFELPRKSLNQLLNEI